MFRYCATVRWEQFFVWYPFVLLASNLIFSTTTLEHLILAFDLSDVVQSRRPYEAVEPLFEKQNWTKWTSFLPTNPSPKSDKSKRETIVPLAKWQLDIRILLHWVITCSFPACSFIKVPLWSLTVDGTFGKRKNFWKQRRRCSAISVSKWTYPKCLPSIITCIRPPSLGRHL